MKFLTIFAFGAIFFIDIFLGLGNGFSAIAQTAVDATKEVVAVQPSFFDKILAFLSDIDSNGVVAGLAILMEMVLRFVKTDKPASILYLVAKAIKMVGAICEKIGEILDKVLPQKTKEG